MAEGNKSSIFAAGWLLAFASLVGTGLLWLTSWHAEAYIKENERQALLNSLNQVIPAQSYDNNLLEDFINIDANSLTSGIITSTAYRARKNNKPIAAAITTVAPDGYNGKIFILVGIDHNGALSGVRIIKHRETPGLGDAIEEQRSDWVLDFNGKSRTYPKDSMWKVKKDGGHFMHFTGATITPRAVVKAIHKSLVFYTKHQQLIFDLPNQQVLNVD